jgi:hypothetical protein
LRFSPVTLVSKLQLGNPPFEKLWLFEHIVTRIWLLLLEAGAWELEVHGAWELEVHGAWELEVRGAWELEVIY